MTPPATLGQRLAFYRRLHGLSQQQLADLAGLHVRTVYHAEHDHTSVRVDNLQRLASALSVTSGQLLGEVGLLENFDPSCGQPPRPAVTA